MRGVPGLCSCTASACGAAARGWGLLKAATERSPSAAAAHDPMSRAKGRVSHRLGEGRLRPADSPC